MKKCDVCGNEISEMMSLNALNNDISTKEIKHACYKCSQLICESKKAMDKLSDSLLRRWIVRLKCTLDKKYNSQIQKEVEWERA